MNYFDVAIIGGGPAGLTAAVYALRSGHSTVVLEGNALGGQMMLAHEIENYPGFVHVSGMDLSDAMTEQARTLGAHFIYENAVKVLASEKGFQIQTGSRTLQTHSVIVATGTRRRELGIPGEKEFLGRGVSYCAVCDGRFFKSMDVAVVGGGNTAVGDALYLASFCRSVTIIHRRDSFRADKILLDRLEKHANIHILLNANVVKVKGNMRMESLDVKLRNGEIQTIPANGIFVAVGSVPEISCLDCIPQLQLDPSGYIVTDEQCRTNIPGLFAAGDIRSKLLRQIATAAADGAIAGTEASEYADTFLF